jgi:hypothetical protein
MLQLSQRSLRLGEPEGHLHRPVQIDGGGQFGTGLLALAELGIQGAKAMMAMGHQRAHAQFIGQSEGLMVIGFGYFDMLRLAPCRNVTEEAQGMRFVATFLVPAGMRQRTLGDVVCLL